MQEILQRVRSLQESSLGFEALGEVVYGLDFTQVDYESYLPKDRSKTDYCRKVLHRSPLECVLLYWPPGTESAIHYHEGFWGFVAVLEGEAHNVEYTFQKKRLLEGLTVVVRKSGVIREPDHIIHKIKNASDTEPLVTAHFYYPPITSFQGMKIYDLGGQRIGILGSKAQSASWQQSPECFEDIEEGAFEFVSFEEAKNYPSHRIVPLVPKPSCDRISEMLAGYYNEQALYYDNFDTDHDSRKKYTDRINELIVKDIQEQYGTVGRKLAIACGTGRRILAIREQLKDEYEVVGVDISTDMCEIAKTRGIETVNEDWLQAQLPDNEPFCVVTFLYAFGHITTATKRKRVLEKILKHLKPGGTFYFDVFNLEDKTEWGPRALKLYRKLQLHYSGYEMGDVFYKKLEGKEIAFLHYFRETEIVNLLQEVGFDPVEVTHVGYVRRSGDILLEQDKGALFIKAGKPK